MTRTTATQRHSNVRGSKRGRRTATGGTINSVYTEGIGTIDLQGETRPGQRDGQGGRRVWRGETGRDESARAGSSMCLVPDRKVDGGHLRFRRVQPPLAGASPCAMRPSTEQEETLKVAAPPWPACREARCQEVGWFDTVSALDCDSTQCVGGLKLNAVSHAKRCSIAAARNTDSTSRDDRTARSKGARVLAGVPPGIAVPTVDATRAEKRSHGTIAGISEFLRETAVRGDELVHHNRDESSRRVSSGQSDGHLDRVQLIPLRDGRFREREGLTSSRGAIRFDGQRGGKGRGGSRHTRLRKRGSKASDWETTILSYAR